MRIFATAFNRLLPAILIGVFLYFILRTSSKEIAYAHQAADGARSESERLTKALQTEPGMPSVPERPFQSVSHDGSKTVPIALRTASFSENVFLYQRVSVQKRPSLAIDGSPLRNRFLARLRAWRTTHDLRLKESDWPERLAQECEANL